MLNNSAALIEMPSYKSSTVRRLVCTYTFDFLFSKRKESEVTFYARKFASRDVIKQEKVSNGVGPSYRINHFCSSAFCFKMAPYWMVMVLELRPLRKWQVGKNVVNVYISYDHSGTPPRFKMAAIGLFFDTFKKRRSGIEKLRKSN